MQKLSSTQKPAYADGPKWHIVMYIFVAKLSNWPSTINHIKLVLILLTKYNKQNSQTILNIISCIKLDCSDFYSNILNE